MSMIKPLSGSVWVQVNSADVARILQLINEEHILMSDIQISEDISVQFVVARRDLKKVQAIVERKGANITIISREGLFWRIQSLKGRPLLVLGMIFLLYLSLILPTMVLFVEVEGNENIPSRLILETAANAGIGFGASRRQVRSEKIKNELLSLLPQLQWAGVNTYGCTAVISVRERAVESKQSARNPISRIVASCDGVITSYIVTQGSGNCSVGQAVQKGQILISGYTDYGNIQSAGRAEGEVFAQTRHEITAVTPSQVNVRTKISDEDTKYRLCLGKKRINFYKGSGISDGTCAKMVTQYHVTLPGGYALPLTLVKERYVSYQLREQMIERGDLPEQMSLYLQSLIRDEGVALTIIEIQEAFDDANDPVSLDSSYGCIEMIGREQEEQIGDLNGETD